VFGDDAEPYIDPELQEGTTPLAKIMGGKFTRTFGIINTTRFQKMIFR
jgi:hypothetical protein